MLYIQICMWRQISIYVNYYTKFIAAANRNETDGKEKPDIIIFQTWKVNWKKHDKHRSEWAWFEKSIISAFYVWSVGNKSSWLTIAILT